MTMTGNDPELVTTVVYDDTPRLADSQLLRGLTVYDAEGTHLGEVRAVYLDREYELTEWAVVALGARLLRHEYVVPLVNAVPGDASLQVPYSEAHIRSAPHRNPGSSLSKSAERDLFAHYGLQWAGDTVTAAITYTQSVSSDEAGYDLGEDDEISMPASGSHPPQQAHPIR